MKIIIRDYSIILFFIIINSNLLARLSLTHACVKHVSFVFFAAMTKDKGFSCSVARRNADDTHAEGICSERYQPLDPVHRHPHTPHTDHECLRPQIGAGPRLRRKPRTIECAAANLCPAASYSFSHDAIHSTAAASCCSLSWTVGVGASTAKESVM